MKNALMNILTRAWNSLRSSSDPAYQYTPFEQSVTYVKYPDFKKIFVMRRRMMWRT